MDESSDSESEDDTNDIDYDPLTEVENMSTEKSISAVEIVEGCKATLAEKISTEDQDEATSPESAAEATAVPDDTVNNQGAKELYKLRFKGRTLIFAEYVTDSREATVNGRMLTKNHGKFKIKSVFINSMMKWPAFNERVH